MLASPTVQNPPDIDPDPPTRPDIDPARGPDELPQPDPGHPEPSQPDIDPGGIPPEVPPLGTGPSA